VQQETARHSALRAARPLVRERGSRVGREGDSKRRTGRRMDRRRFACKAVCDKRLSFRWQPRREEAC